ncbi:cation-transporting ATPase, partial [Reticulomyxa filosa]
MGEYAQRMRQAHEEEERRKKEMEQKQREAEQQKYNDPTNTQDLQKKLFGDWMKQLEELDAGDGEMEVKPVQLGDASIASPFTSKTSSIESTLDIIRQGRCTLVTTLQMYSILALNCMVTAYSLSVLYFDGVKYGDTQMTITGMMIAALFFFVTQSEPQEFLSAQQPHVSVFCPYIVLSLVGQILTHLCILMLAVKWSKPYTPTDE